MNDKAPAKKAEAAQAAVNPDAPPLYINGQYIRDLSFEVPNAPQIFTKMTEQPKIEVNVDIEGGRLKDNTFNINLKFNVEGKIQDDVAFVVELVYGCIATLNVPEEHIEPVLLVEIPRHLFPFARSIIATAVRDGGFPPLMITPIDFAALYRDRLEAAKKAADEKKATAAKAN